MKIAGVKVTLPGAAPFLIDMEIPDGIEFGDQNWIRPATHAGWGWNNLSQDYIGVVSCGTGGKGSGLFAIRAADSVPGAMYSCLDWLAVQDMPAHRGYNTVYGRYGEVWRKRLAADGTPVDPRGIAQGDEMAVISELPTVGVNPFNPNPLGLCEGYRIMAESLGEGPWFNPSVALQFGTAGITRFRTGINVFHNAIDSDGEFLALPEGCALAWYAPDGNRTRITVIDGKFQFLPEKVAKLIDVTETNPLTFLGVQMKRLAVGLVMLLASTFALAGSTVTVLPNSGNLVRPGFTFSGWGTAASGSGITYQPGQQFEIGASNMTLYALWQAIPTQLYSVSYAANGAASGSVPVDGTLYTPGDPPPPPPPVTGCAPGEVMGPGDILNPMTMGYGFPANWLSATGDRGTAVQFVADPEKTPNGFFTNVHDEGNHGTKEVVISTCPHNFTPLVEGVTCRMGVSGDGTFEFPFGPATQVSECPLTPGGTYYLNFRDFRTPRGTVATKFYNFPR